MAYNSFLIGLQITPPVLTSSLGKKEKKTYIWIFFDIKKNSNSSRGGGGCHFFAGVPHLNRPGVPGVGAEGADPEQTGPVLIVLVPTGSSGNMAVFFSYHITCPVYTWTEAYTRQVIFHMVPEKHGHVELFTNPVAFDVTDIHWVIKGKWNFLDQLYKKQKNLNFYCVLF